MSQLDKKEIMNAIDDWTFVNDEIDAISEEKTVIKESSESSKVRKDKEENDTNSTDICKDINVRLRTGEKIEIAQFQHTQLVQDFMKKYCGVHLNEKKRLRLIYMGTLLSPEMLMGNYNIQQDSVIHCVINESPRPQVPNSSDSPFFKRFSDPLNLFLLVTGVILYGFWTLLYHFPHLFNWKSMAMLYILSAIHISVTISRITAA